MSHPSKTVREANSIIHASEEKHVAVRLYDLHIHSSCSDGRLAVEAVVQLAVNAGLTGFSLTDHDTVSGLARAKECADASGLVFIPGLELNTDYVDDEVHILGFFINPEHPELNLKLADLKAKRKQRARLIVDRLNELGFSMDFERVRAVAGDKVIGRPHIARTMVECGFAATEKEAFDRYIGRGQPAFVPRYSFTPEEAIKIIIDSGGLPFLAHPGKIRDQAIIPALVQMGLCGLEVYYPEHSEDEIHRFLELAEYHGLLVSGGSDFHGPGSGEKREMLGLSYIEEDGFQRILEYLKGKRD